MTKWRNLMLGESLEALIDNRGKNPPFEADGVPAVSGMCVGDGTLDLSVAKRVSLETWKRWMPIPTRRHDVVLTSEAPLGRVALVPSDQRLVLTQRVFGLRGKPGILDSRFLFYAFQSGPVQSDLQGRATGTTVLGVRQPALRQVRIPAPNFTEQRAIAEVLGALDDKIAANAKAMTLADDLAGAAVRMAMAPDDTVRLADIALVTMGSSPPGSSYNQTRSGMVFYQGNRDFGFRFPVNRLWTTEPQRTAEPGDTLVSVRAPVGELNLAAEQTCIGRGLASIRSTAGMPATLFHTLKQAPELWAPYEAEGTVFGSINKKQMDDLRVPLVRATAGNSLEPMLASLESEIAALDAESRTLTSLRDALLPALMSGKLRVRDAGRQVEEVV